MLFIICPAGPSYTTPFLGGIVEMVQDPHAFWERQRSYSFPGLSWNSIVTKFTVMVTDPAVIRHVFNNNRCVMIPQPVLLPCPPAC